MRALLVLSLLFLSSCASKSKQTTSPAEGQCYQTSVSSFIKLKKVGTHGAYFTEVTTGGEIVKGYLSNDLLVKFAKADCDMSYDLILNIINKGTEI